MPTESEYEVVRAMEKFGGSFVKALAECFGRADAINFEKLRTTFPEIWNEYREIVEKYPDLAK